MKLVINFGGEILPESAKETSEKIDEIFTAFPSDLCVGNSGQVWFSFISGEPAELGNATLEHSNLLCHLDISLKLGVAIWHCDSVVSASMAAAGNAHADDSMWVSLAPHRPHSAGEVLLDPWTGTIADSKTVLSFAELRTVAEEFCQTGTGFRPNSIQWVPGHPTGEIF